MIDGEIHGKAHRVTVGYLDHSDDGCKTHAFLFYLFL